MAELISISWGERKSKGLVVAKTGGHHKFENSSSRSMNAALAAVISKLEQWVTQKAFLYFCLGLKNVLVSFVSLIVSNSCRLRRQQQNPGLFGKMRTARYSPENPDSTNSDMDEEDDELQLQIPWHTHSIIQDKSSIKRGNIVAVWWNLKVILKE